MNKYINSFYHIRNLNVIDGPCRYHKVVVQEAGDREKAKVVGFFLHGTADKVCEKIFTHPWSFESIDHYLNLILDEQGCWQLNLLTYNMRVENTWKDQEAINMFKFLCPGFFK